MSEEQIHSKLQEIFQQVLKDKTLEIVDSMTADDHKKWDSMTHLLLILEVEKRFSIRFKNAEIASLENVGQLKDLISKKS